MVKAKTFIQRYLKNDYYQIKSPVEVILSGLEEASQEFISESFIVEVDSCFIY